MAGKNGIPLRASRKRLWVGLLAGGALVILLGLVCFFALSGRFGATIAGRPISAAERERRLNLAQANERHLISLLKKKAFDFGEKSTQILSIKGPHDSSFAFSPDGTKLAIGKQGGVIAIHDLATGQVGQTLPGLQKRVRNLAYSPVEHVLISVGGSAISEAATERNSICVWDLESGKRRLEFWLSSARAVAISPDGSRFLVDGSVRDIETGNEIRDVGPASDCTFSPCGKYLAIYHGRQVHILDATSGRMLRTVHATAPGLSRVALAPDEKTLAVFDDEILLVDLDTGTERKLPVVREVAGKFEQLHLHEGAFTPDGKFLVTVDMNSSSPTKFWDVQSRTERQFPAVFPRGVFAISPGGLLMAAASNPHGDDEVRIYVMPYALND